MSYRYEVHCHTIVSSACGRSLPEEYIPAYKAVGYDGLYITEHFYLGNTCVDRSLPWKDWVHRFCQAYRDAKAAGDKAGLKVFFGWEATYDGDDYLIYGLDEEWLTNHPEVITWDQKTQYEAVHAAGGLVVQAHPYRCRGYMPGVNLHPFQCDAWEVANEGNRPYENTLAKRYAEAHGMLMTAGSDIHKATWVFEHGRMTMVTDEPLNSAADYVKLILSGKGFHIETPEGAFSEEPVDFDLPVRYYDRENRVEREGVEWE